MTGSLLVALVGVDGSGKTTLARGLARRLRAEGVRARYFENAGGRPPMNWLARRLGHDDAIGWLGIERYQAVERRFRHLAMRRSARWARRSPGRVAVLDRWSCCQHAANRGRGSTGEEEARALYAGLPWPDLVVFLEVEPLVAQQRVADRGRDTETLEHLVAFDAAYRSLPEWGSFTVVDASPAAGEVLDEVAALVRPLLPDE